jgi:REP element-mobilizing transposase RayT
MYKRKQIQAQDHVHFLIQSIPGMSPIQIITTVESLTAREIFKKHPEMKEKLWDGDIWTDGYFVNTGSKFGYEVSISRYVRDQGVEKDYKVLNSEKQLTLF